MGLFLLYLCQTEPKSLKLFGFYILAMNNEWKEQLMRQARVHHMCAENRLALSHCENKEEAIRLYKKTIDWALEEGYPGLPIIRSHFGGMEAEGIFVDRKFSGETLIQQQVYVLHHCTGTITVDLNVKRRLIPMIYLADDCDITIKRSSPCVAASIRVPVYSFGDNIVNVISSGETDFRVYHFDLKM